VRLIGINAPERGECWAEEATVALRDHVGDGPVWLTRDVSAVDRYGRTLRYVANRDLDDVGALLVGGGDAIARSYPPDVGNDDRYALLQFAAEREGLGLWAPDACGPPAAPSSIAVEVHANAEGDDNTNLNDEWVRFTNTGDGSLDLEGWGVKDESAIHRHTFGPLVLAPGASVTLRTGCGTDAEADVFWCQQGSAVWNNDGDTVFLLDPVGNIVVADRY
jgi:hypothetical protein